MVFPRSKKSGQSLSKDGYAKKTIPRKVKLTIAGVETIVELWFDKIPKRICSLCRIIDHPSTRCGDAHQVPQELINHECSRYVTGGREYCINSDDDAATYNKPETSYSLILEFDRDNTVQPHHWRSLNCKKDQDMTILL